MIAIAAHLKQLSYLNGGNYGTIEMEVTSEPWVLKQSQKGYLSSETYHSVTFGLT